MSTISADWQLYLELIEVRNQLVHSAAVKRTPAFHPVESLDSRDAQRALGSVNNMMRHGTQLFPDLIPRETYDGGTFEPVLTRTFPQERVPLSRFLSKPFRLMELGVPPFRAFGPKPYREVLGLEDLVPPENFVMLEIQPLFFSSATNEGMASLKVMGYTWDEHSFLQPP